MGNIFSSLSLLLVYLSRKWGLVKQTAEMWRRVLFVILGISNESGDLEKGGLGRRTPWWIDRDQNIASGCICDYSRQDIEEFVVLNH